MIKGAINRSAVGTVGVDDLDRLPFVQTSRAAAPCRYNLKICRHIAIPLPLAHWRICLEHVAFLTIQDSHEG